MKPARVLLLCGLVLLQVLPGNGEVTDGEASKKCSIDACETCENPNTECEICEAGMLRSKDGSACLTCMDNCDDCVEKDGKADCGQCSSSYFHLEEERICKRCPGNCEGCKKTADGGHDCDTCNSGYYPVEDARKCQDCMANCIECASSSECLICQSGFFLSFGACLECTGRDNGLGCTSCTGPAQCDSCLGNAFFNTDTLQCQDCLANCKDCTSAEMCDLCTGNYFLSANKDLCLSLANCATPGADGCSKCDLGYRLTEDKTCEKCTPLTETSCRKCKAETFGFFYDVASPTPTCTKCMDDCHDCSPDGTTCTTCKTGMVFDGTSCVEVQCANSGLTEPHCDQCSTKWYDDQNTLCQDCAADLGDVNTEPECRKCKAADRGNLFVEGKCVDVADCAAAVLPQHECEACRGRTWNNVDSVCDGHDCSGALESSEACVSCSSETEYRVWNNPRCASSHNTCSGTFDTELECNPHKCSYFWHDNGAGGGECQAIDCGSTSLSVAQCAMCERKYHDGTDCKIIDCADTDLPTALCDDFCPESYHDGTNCITFDCTVAITPADACDSAKCPNHYHDGSDCVDLDCTDTTTPAATCTSKCAGYYHDGSECVAIDCNDGTLPAAQCDADCPTKYHDGSACVALDCTDITTPAGPCDSLKCQGYKHDGSACVALTCNDNSLAEPECLACGPLFYHDGTNCHEFSCDVDGIGAPEALCNTCPGKTIKEGNCVDVQCDGDIDSAAKCSVCKAYWVSGTSSCSFHNCDRDVLDSQETCEACKHHYWGDDPVTPCQSADCNALNTLTTPAACLACSDKNYYWNGHTCLVAPCDSEVLQSEEMCVACSLVWQSGSCETKTAAACSVDPTVVAGMSMDECFYCPKVAWYEAEGDNSEGCRVVDCENDALDTPDKCESCDKFFEDSTCRGAFDCTSDIIDSDLRCATCSSTSQTKAWDDSLSVCWPCPDNCLSCDENKCLKCVSGMYYCMEEKACKACPDSTSELKDETSCTACMSVWQEDKCFPCPLNCLSCSLRETCDVCSTGLVWDNTEQKCLSCLFKNEVECKSCGSPMAAKYFPEGICQDCPLGCVECKAGVDGVECSACASGYFLEDKSCETCTGATLNTADKCEICGASNQYFDPDTEQCPNCMENCLECTDGNSCSRCKVGKYFTNGACTNCASGCLSCKNSDSCDLCENSKFWNADDTACKLCDSECAQCDKPGCQRCNPGFFLQEGKCERCIDGCDWCSDGDTCDSCKSTYCYDKDETTCRKLVSDQGCKACRLVGTKIDCLSCQDGTYQEICKACDVQGCKDCSDDSTKCKTCMDAQYYDEKTNMCKGCGDHCAECDKDGCSKCTRGYYKDKDTCKGCAPGCPSCSGEDECLEGCGAWKVWDSEENECADCIDHCEDCSGGIKSCRRCSDQYYLAESDGTPSCQKCGEGCQECKMAGETLRCEVCLTSYYGNDGQCLKCSDKFAHCSNCTDSSEFGIMCGSCSTGYVLTDDGKACVACNINGCNKCVDPPPYCKSCYDDLVPTLKGDECVSSCYSCEGEECINKQNTNSTRGPCKGIGGDRICLATYNVTEGTVKRFCSDEPCTNAGEETCNDAAGAGKECRRCCKENKCNDYEMVGEPSLASRRRPEACFIGLVLAVWGVMMEIMMNTVTK